MTVPAMARPGLSIPVRSASATSAVVPARAASPSPADSRAATSRRAGRPARTRARSASRAAATWKYIAIPARNPAAHPALAVPTVPAAAVLPNSRARSARRPAAATTNTVGTTTSRNRLTGLRT